MSKEKTKRRIYIVGGKGKNIPPWITAAFDVEQFEQDHTRGREPDPTKAPDAIVVLSSWVGHKHFYDARALAEKLNIPMILSPGGWSASLKSAADLGAEWFINEIEAAKTNGELNDNQTEELEHFIDNAWREAYTREWSARSALERRFSKDQAKLESIKAELASLTKKEAAAQRVIEEVRAAAAAQREALEKAREETERRIQEIEARNGRVSVALSDFISSISELFSSADHARQAAITASTVASQAANVLQRAQDVAKHKLDVLNIALSGAEDGHHDVNPLDINEEDTFPEAYKLIQTEFLKLVRASGLPEPKVSQALLTDPCDVTDADYVRLNPRSCNSCKDHDPAWHARHVFGHWLCDLHGSESYETPTRPGFEGISDAVADFLAGVFNIENHEKSEETVPASNLDTES